MDREKRLFTPGPLTTSRTVKEAMLRDLGSRDFAFIAQVREIRERLVALGGVSPDDYTAILMQGSGTFGLEAVVGSVIPPDGRLLVVINGAYGRRILKIASVLGISATALTTPEDRPSDVEAVASRLDADREITHVAVVHLETTTGILNPVAAIGEVIKARGLTYIVDAMSSFGAIPIDLAEMGIDYLISSANKCIEGVPGFSIILARTEALRATAGFARSLSLDLVAQYRGLEADGQFRFTPPTHALAAFHRALLELEAQGGVDGRAARYRANHEALTTGMCELGFETYLRPEDQGPIITSFLYPEDPNFDFDDFYRRLNEKGFVIYPGKVSDADCFRIGTIGRIDVSDVRALLVAIRETLDAMDVDLYRSRAMKGGRT